ncbi:hypothetical protein [Halorubrum sp. CBA1229]|jgi:hypothetical protein|uniref:hypothetical protein n=1 Tax=Halorubrum sp. CBA1229 TaxID=1853699 RepID=UPI0011CE899C|nr:hypothetical protein [Halorubrum sp. CBA1229]QKY17891.1 hypothetical protein Hrr1229_013730 [Halorubrum sp. CBA1229]
MTNAQAEIELPETVSPGEVAEAVAESLKNNQVEIIERESDPGYELIEAKSQPSLLSWGEEIYIQITPGKVEVASRSPSQIIDWGKSKQNVKQVEDTVRNHLSASGTLTPA